MSDRLVVAILVETSNTYGRGVLDGIIAYQRERDLWSIYFGELGSGGRPPDWFKNWKGDGVIAGIETEALAATLQHRSLPTVDVCATHRVRSIPRVSTDDFASARLAVQHLVDRGFRTLAYCGGAQLTHFERRERFFTALAAESGRECHTFRSPASRNRRYSWNSERERLKSWVRGLPKPVGVMACDDFEGQQLLEVCRELEVAVPEQVAVIGVNNDVRLCGLCMPPLSSVIPDTNRIGHEAAHLLERMMRGLQVSAEDLLIPPLGISERSSSDMYAINDQAIATAMRFIREHARNGITVADVLRVVPLSKRKFIHRFQTLMHRTPHAEITRIRMEDAKKLLHETDLTLSEIADRSGFANSTYLSVAFKKYVGVPPREYRRTLSPNHATSSQKHYSEPLVAAFSRKPMSAKLAM